MACGDTNKRLVETLEKLINRRDVVKNRQQHKTYERFTTEAYTSRPEKVTITDDLLGDFSEEAEPNACGRWAGLKRVG
ncbi:hypothetical protein DPMN_005811 [Dreissena polymorpha]|uniref:Uncharacterized protein n=1 Tax=Dreissena polymorpha TaxID=45954 RepID=A0A9D4MU18_DREPO|nr:hypothetical protein DPMN_005811 [Dreissena polymorpha]